MNMKVLLSLVDIYRSKR